MIKLKALKDFEDQDGSFKKDDEFIVNEERAFVLTRQGKAERAANQDLSPPREAEKADESAGTATALPPFGVPRPIAN